MTGMNILLTGAAPRAELVARFAGFVRTTDVVCAWGYYGIDLLLASGGSLPAERIDLRAEAHRLTNRKLGSLEAYAATLGPPPAPLTLGRAGRRLAQIAQIARAWHAR